MRYYITIYACDECGMEDEIAALAYDEEADRYKCPDCGSASFAIKKVWCEDEPAQND